ncbi:MAG: hypothetical protein K2K95_00365, partial [Muribaculaceae bacterium]|nr:hypothetical protein [Muribaculaceae bacterium]
FRKLDISEGILAGLVSILSFIISVTILVIIHEGGHLVCGLLSGYKFVSFRIFNLTFIKVDGKLKIKRFGVAGTGGQCLLDPPDLPVDKIPTGWYNAGGVLANIIVGLLVLPLLWADLPPLLSVAVVIFLITDLFLILMNGIPMQPVGLGNDAYNMLYLNRNQAAKRGLVMQLRSNALIQNGVRPKDMPEEWFEVTSDINYSNPLELSVPLMRASRLMYEYRMEEALMAFENLYSHKKDIMPLYQKEIACELCYLLMTTANGKEKASVDGFPMNPDSEENEQTLTRVSKILDKELRRYVAAYRKVMSSKERLECAIALYLDGDRERAEKIFSDLKKRQNEYLLQGEVKSDIALMERMLGQ